MIYKTNIIKYLPIASGLLHCSSAAFTNLIILNIDAKARLEISEVRIGTLKTSFFSPAHFTMSRDCYFFFPRLLIADPTLAAILDWLTWPWCDTCMDPMPDKINSDYLKLLYCKFQKYEVMTMSVVDVQPKRHANPSYKATKPIERTT